MTKVVLGYWNVRRRGQYIRHLLAYTGIDFTEVQYSNSDKWLNDKHNLGLEFPNLPYLIDGDFKLTESAAIARYIILKSGKTELLGKNVQDQGKVDNLIGVFTDAFNGILALAWNKDHQTLKDAVLQKARPKLDYLKKNIGTKPFALGYLTLFDFIIAELLYYFETLYPNEKDNYAFWWRIRQNFENLPEVQAYYKRPDAIIYPFIPDVPLVVKPKTIKHGYWYIRSRGQIQRLLLSYFGVQFQDIIYNSRQQWANVDKNKLGLQFPNVPYLIDGNYSITQAEGIRRYIIRRWGKPEFLGKDPQDRAKMDNFLQVFSEVKEALIQLMFDKDYQVSKIPVLQKYRVKLDQMNAFVGEKQTVMGYLTLADFRVAEQSHFFETIYPEQYKNWPFLQRVRQAFDKLPEIVAYYEKPTAFKGKFAPYPEITFIDVK